MDEGGAAPLPQTKTLTESRREERTSGPAVDPHSPTTRHNGLQHVCGSKTRRTVQGHVPGECTPPLLSVKSLIRSATQQSSELTGGGGGSTV